MSEFRSTIVKDEINLLPLANFEGSVVVVDSAELFDQALEILSTQKVVGFDTETKPVFAKGKKK